MKSLTLTSEAFKAHETVPRKYTGDGQDISPPLSWSDLPPGTKELALIVDDPDAPTAKPWVHWVLYAIPPDRTHLPEGIAHASHVAEPVGLLQGKNSWGNVGYGGPAPPKNHGLHHYYFKLYALDLALNVDAGATKETVMDAIAGHVLAHGELMGTYQR